MLSKSLLGQIKVRYYEFIREPSALFWVMFMPLIWMVLLGFAFARPRAEIYGVGIEQESLLVAPLASYAEALKLSPQLKVRDKAQAEILRLFQRGEIEIVVKNSSTDPAAISYLYDPKNPIAQRARDYIDQLIQTKAGRTDPQKNLSETIEAQGGRYVDFLIPGLLGLSIMSSSLFGVGMTIVSNRKEQLLKRYCATPMPPYEYIISHIFGRFMVLAFEFVTIWLAGILIFDFKIYGSLALYILTAVIGAAAFSSLAILFASSTRSLATISGLTNLCTLPMMVLSGVFFSKSNFPDWLRDIAQFLPLTALNDALRKVALEGLGVQALWKEWLLLSIITLVATLGAKLRFRWY